MLILFAYAVLLLIGFLIGYFVNQYLLLGLGYYWLWVWYSENSIASHYPDVPGSGVVLVVFGGAIFFAGIFLLIFQWFSLGLLAKILSITLLIWICKVLGPLFYDAHISRTK